jgi:hypothetical protein
MPTATSFFAFSGFRPARKANGSKFSSIDMYRKASMLNVEIDTEVVLDRLDGMIEKINHLKHVDLGKRAFGFLA